MNKSFIKAISSYLPEQALSNEDIAKAFPEWSAIKVAKKIGINERRVANPMQTSVDLAVKASEKLFNEHDIEKKSIDFTILCTQSPDYFLPTSACIIQDKIGVPKSSGAFDFNLGCSGYVYGLAISKGLIAAGIAKNVLLITSETYTKFIHPKDKVNRTIFGDAATATVISTDGYAEIKDFSLGTDGSGADKLIVKNGGFRNPYVSNDLVFDDANNPKSSDHLYMDGSSIFNFTLDMVPKLVEMTLTKNHIKQYDIKQFIFHQANKYMLSFLQKKINIDDSKFYQNMEKTGNTVSSTIPIALDDYLKKNKLDDDSLILLAGFGVGYSWAGTVLKYKN